MKSLVFVAAISACAVSRTPPKIHEDYVRMGCNDEAGKRTCVYMGSDKPGQICAVLLVLAPGADEWAVESKTCSLSVCDAGDENDAPRSSSKGETL
jgi:hypothetical protein